ncbi:hypothetical protein D3C76_1208560 [compost metagenome]
MFGTGGNIVGQGFGFEVQTERLLRQRSGELLFPRRTAADERLQPVAIVPDPHNEAADDHSPQDDFNDRRHRTETLAVKQSEQGLQPCRCFVVVRGFDVRFALAKSVACHRFLVLEGRLIEQGLDTVPGRLAGEGLIQQARAVGGNVRFARPHRLRCRQQQEHRQ